MPLSAVGVKHAKAGRHGDGHGLYLLVKPSGAKSWMLRVQVCGRRRDIGLGSIAALSLAEAREKAAELRKHALNGRDPIVERDKNKRIIPTFRSATKEAHAELRGNWTGKNAGAFLTTLSTYAFPKLGNCPSTLSVPAMCATCWRRYGRRSRVSRARSGCGLARSLISATPRGGERPKHLDGR
jgi:hypothetical protein